MAKYGRLKFSRVFPYRKTWNGKKYAWQEVEAFAATIPSGWLVVTVLVKYF